MKDIRTVVTYLKQNSNIIQDLDTSENDFSYQDQYIIGVSTDSTEIYSIDPSDSPIKIPGVCFATALTLFNWTEDGRKLEIGQYKINKSSLEVIDGTFTLVLNEVVSLNNSKAFNSQLLSADAAILYDAVVPATWLVPSDGVYAYLGDWIYTQIQKDFGYGRLLHSMGLTYTKHKNTTTTEDYYLYLSYPYKVAGDSNYLAPIVDNDTQILLAYLIPGQIIPAVDGTEVTHTASVTVSEPEWKNGILPQLAIDIPLICGTSTSLSGFLVPTGEYTLPSATITISATNYQNITRALEIIELVNSTNTEVLYQHYVPVTNNTINLSSITVSKKSTMYGELHRRIVLVNYTQASSFSTATASITVTYPETPARNTKPSNVLLGYRILLEDTITGTVTDGTFSWQVRL